MDIETQYMINYLEGKLSPEEKRAFEQQIAQSPELQKELKDIRFVWEISGELKQHKHVDAARNWKEVSRRISFYKYRHKFLRISRNAAAILLLPVLMATLYLYNTSTEENSRPIEQIELSSAPGLVTKVTLPDGSDVWLNSGSTLTYPQRFTGDKRQVSLSGEAYFSVKADRNHRFDVIANNALTVSAYGTEFNVYAYDDEPIIESTLVSGNIEVSTNDRSDTKTISPGQQTIWNKASNTLEVREANLTVKTSWKDGKMVFRRANMTEITKRLSRKFNVDIHLEGEELFGYEYSATFTTETLDEILRLLEKSAPIKCRFIEPEQSEDYSYSKRVVLISMKK